MRRWFLSIAALGLVACADIPQPFRHQGRGNDLVRPVFDDAVDPVIEQPSAPKRLTARLGNFTGLPGDGNDSLRKALKGALERRGLLVVSEGGDVTISPNIIVGPDKLGETPLDISWSVLSKTGENLGEAKQHGQVSTLMLSGNWGHLARDIAEGGADGIVTVVQSTFTKGRGG